ncbi:MAG: hypothetical protein GC179_09455 [Anaerolineaceae bacterium]|nr:hypothetical protein [Anaerolineaceae bacterium]
MPIQIRWYDNTKSIILWEIEGQWTLNEMHEIYTIGNNMCLEVPENTINALIDMTRSNSLPSNILSALTTRSRTNTPNFDMTVVVSNNALVKAFLNIMGKMTALHDQFALVRSMEEGLAFIEKRRRDREPKSPT